MLFGGLGAAMPGVYTSVPRKSTATRIDIRIFISISSLLVVQLAAVTPELQRMKRVAVDGATRLSIIDGPYITRLSGCQLR